MVEGRLVFDGGWPSLNARCPTLANRYWAFAVCCLRFDAEVARGLHTRAGVGSWTKGDCRLVYAD